MMAGSVIDRDVAKDAPNGGVFLRVVLEDDLPIFFRHHLDARAKVMAAFTAENPKDETAFLSHWNTTLRNDAVVKQTILWRGEVVGHVLLFELLGKPSVAYWIGREYWGRGIATHALARFLRSVVLRPIYARGAKDNIASRRVLEKCGFAVCGEERSFANARGTEVEELILQLRGA
jgi:RimJ/RimL family protein N-acetyltransferase